MSRFPDGECDVEPERTSETQGPEQPVGRANDRGQVAELMGVSTRHTRRILAAYRKEGVAALAHGHRGRRPPNATPETTKAEVLHLASARYMGTNHTRDRSDARRG